MRYLLREKNDYFHKEVGLYIFLHILSLSNPSYFQLSAICCPSPIETFYLQIPLLCTFMLHVFECPTVFHCGSFLNSQLYRTETHYNVNTKSKLVRLKFICERTYDICLSGHGLFNSFNIFSTSIYFSKNFRASFFFSTDLFISTTFLLSINQLMDVQYDSISWLFEQSFHKQGCTSISVIGCRIFESWHFNPKLQHQVWNTSIIFWIEIPQREHMLLPIRTRQKRPCS